MRWILRLLGLYAWTQDLKKEDRDRSWFHRRGWIHPVDQRGRRSFAWSLCLGGTLQMWGGRLSVGGGDRDSDIQVALFAWPVMLWLTYTGSRRRQRREWGVTVSREMWHLQIHWGHADDWGRTARGWRWGCFVPDLLFGTAKRTVETLHVEDVQIPMPERTYPARVTLERNTWKRPRWLFPKVILGAEIDIPGGLGVPGKGENAWDCGDDAIYGMYTPARTVEEAIAAVVASALRTRRRYGGRNWRPETASA